MPDGRPARARLAGGCGIGESGEGALCYDFILVAAKAVQSLGEMLGGDLSEGEYRSSCSS